jgi:RHS repeat-associated protein
MRKLHLRLLGFILAFFTIALVPAAHAQYPGYVSNSNDTGLPSYGSFISSKVDTVNLGTGGVSIRIPIVSRKGRGITYLYLHQYESKLWSMVPTVVTLGNSYPTTYLSWVPDNSGTSNWNAKDNVTTSLNWTEQIYTCAPADAVDEDDDQSPQSTILVRSNWVYVSPDGAKHQVPLRNTYPIAFPGQCGDSGPGTPVLVEHTDNDHIQVDITQDQMNSHSGIVITEADGTHHNPYGVSQDDRNGNLCCGSSNSYVTDTLGRPLWAYDSASTGNEYIYDVYDSGGNVQKIVVDFETINVSTAFPTTSYDQYHPVSQYSGTLRVVSKITLANGLAYNFSYDDPNNPGQPNPFGELTKITLPTGGYVKYKWTTISQADKGPQDPVNVNYLFSIDARRLAERDVSEDGTTEQAWTYTYPGAANNPNAGAGGETVVTDPIGDTEAHSFGMCGVTGFVNNFNPPSVEFGVTYRDSSGNLLKSVTSSLQCDWGPVYIAYLGTNLPNNNAELTENVRNVRTSVSTTTLGDTNQVSQTQTDFADCYTYTIYVSTRTECRDNPTEIREYDYGVGTPGPLLRKTDFTYLHNSNSTYLNAHLWDLVTQKSVYDGNSNLFASTQYSYDTTTITPTSGVPQHDTNYSSSNTVRGNPTIVSRWLNTTNSWLTTTNYYNDVGNLVQTTDPGGHTYTLSYTDNFTDSTNRNSQGYLTSVTSPTTSNGVSHIEGKQYYWYTGLTAAVCGQNAPSPATCSNTLSAPVADYASYTYDLMGRPLSVFHGDGGTTSFTFSDLSSTSTPITVSSSSAIDSSNTLVNTAVIDGLGRVSQTQLNSDPEGVDYVDTTFDAVERVSTTSNPHRSSSSSTDGVTTTQYDGLGRTNLVIPPDGTSSSNNVVTYYRGNSVTVVDQAGKARRSYTDGLGRLIEVDEPAAGTALPGMAATTATGSVTVLGSEQSISLYVDTGQQQCTLYDCAGNCMQWQEIYQWQTTYDAGTVSVTANGHTDSASYGSGSSPTSIASALASAINADSSASVTAASSGAVLNLTAKAAGLGDDYSISESVTSSYPGTYPVSFDVEPRMTNLTGGANAIPSFPPSESTGSPYVTLYTYDALDNLTCVEQHGSTTGQTGCSSSQSNDSSSSWHIRRFAYDSLGRLTNATNPESGTISYTYDADGNVLTKTDARSITTTMTYDQLHRVLSKGYSDSTPAVSFVYDISSTNGVSIQNPIGRLVMAQTSGSTYNYIIHQAYDTRGRVATDLRWNSARAALGICCAYTLTAAYNYAGGVTSDGNEFFTIYQQYDAAARLKQLTSSWSDSQHPATLLSVDQSVGYSPAGTLAKAIYGNGLVELDAYNSRLQPSQLRTYNPNNNNADVLNLNYGFTASNGANNGNLVSFVSTATQVFMRSYTYDELNRLSTMSSPTDASGCYGLTWTYDAWANRTNQTTSSGACTESHPTIAPNNQFTGTPYQYDAAGNMIQDASHSYTYDAENRLTTVDGGSTATYVYDAEGDRIEKIAGGVTTVYYYDPVGNLTTETNGGDTPNIGYVYSGGQLLAEYESGSTLFVHKDHLGSTRVTTTYSTTSSQNAQVSDSMDYMPYGELWSGSSSTTHKFTGKERDVESGLDNFGARYYSSTLGRFVSADWSVSPEPIPYADFGDPQSLNLFTYVGNNPLTNVDSNGHCTDASCIVAVTGWIASHVGEDGGIKQFAENVGIGILKGTGSFVDNTIKTGEAVSSSNPGQAVAALTAPSPAVLTPSNSTQADVSAGTQVALTAASALIPGGDEAEAAEIASNAGKTSKVEDIMNTVKEGGFDVKTNPKAPNQEGNVTITHPSEPGTKLNVRVETHPLEAGGKPVTHANAELVKPGPKNRPVVKSNEHIEQ